MSRARLVVLDAEVEVRTTQIRNDAPDWPCRSGCADCCKSLGAPMLASPEEWRRLEAGLATLSEAARTQIEAGFDAMDETALRGDPVVCPVLDEADRCRLYEFRPLRCRTHGYYAGRAGGYWCDRIEARVEAGGAEGLIFGRHEALDRSAARALGAPLSWSEWRALGAGHTYPPSC